MGDHGPARLCQKLPKRGRFRKRNGVDDRQPIPRSHLDQAEFGTKGVLGDKFGVERNDWLFGNLIAELPQMFDRVYGIVLQRYAWYQ